MMLLVVSWLSLITGPNAIRALQPPATLPVLRVADASPLAGASFVPNATQSSSSSSSQSHGLVSHTFGLGGMFGAGAFGSGVGIRYWFLGHVGLDARFLLSSGNLGGFTPSGGFSLDAAPSVIVMLKTPDSSKGFDVRPYIGAGDNWTHAGANVVSTGSAVSGSGTQYFAGAEMGFSQASSLAISGEVVYNKRPASLVNVGVKSGLTGLVAFHFYVD